MNKYVVKLSPQELRHARDHGRFYEFVEEIGRLSFWREHRVFTKHQLGRMRAVELSAELTILLAEGPQDKKTSVDLYYGEYQTKFPFAKEIRNRLTAYLSWIASGIPALSKSRFRKPTDLYGLIGALEKVTRSGRGLSKLDPRRAGSALVQFERELAGKKVSRRGAAYLAASSRQTDNITPRTTRIDILSEVLEGAR
jgi:hypothetical protein